jgi:hypothetical protein
MAIEPVMAGVIERLRDALPNNRVLCLGYPDILTTCEPPSDPERQSIAKWHHWKGGIEDAGHFFGRQELDAEYWDVTQARGPEKVVDLNDVYRGDYDGDLCLMGHPAAHIGKFALIIDPGTLEHIANIGNCWRTICAVTALNGLVVHCNPLGMPNHGFYSISPTAYADIYEANGFRIELLLHLSGPLENRVIAEAPKHNRFAAVNGAAMLCVARKMEDVPFIWPVQTKYRKNPTLKAAQ